MRQTWMSWLLMVVASCSVAAEELAVAAAASLNYELNGPAPRFENTTSQMKQAAVISTASKHKKTAHAIVDSVLSPEGAAVLRNYALTPPAHQ